MNYAELHARSAFSFLRGASSPPALAQEAARLELPAVALCDRDGVYGAPRFYQAAREHSVRAPVGAEITLEDGSVLPLLAATRTGYQNLCQLITTAKLTERRTGPGQLFVTAITNNRPPAPEPAPLAHARSHCRAGPCVRAAPFCSAEPGADPAARKRPCFATWAELAAHAEGLIALTGDEEGPVRRAWQAGGAATAAPALARLATIFGPDRLYVELQRQRVRGEERELRFLADLAAAHRLPLVATGGVDYATRAGRLLADVFTCLRHHTTLDAAGRLLAPNAERHLKSAHAMAELFHDFPEAVENSARLTARLEFTLRDLGYRFPEFPVPPGETMESHLHDLTYAGARERFGTISPAARAQLEKELALIAKLGFCGYFLIVWDICRWARERGILAQGRGSAANSAVCYALRITAVDPIAGRLLFERFLSEGRVGADGHPSWPDVDLDLPSGELREQVIQEVYRRYAPRGAAMTANVITYRGRSTARELGKVLGLPDDVLDRFSALFAGGDYQQTLGLEDQLALAGLPKTHPRAPVLAALARQLRGLPRHLGQHSGGMVICGGQLDRVVPLEPATMPGRVVVQWDKDDCEELGIVKVDFLGLGMMAVLQDSLALCAQRGRGPAELHKIPAEDPATFAVMQAADTVGVFQIESRAQMATLPRLKPHCFYDVAIEVAIVRPGPIVGKVAHPLIRRRAGQEPISYPDPRAAPLLGPILDRTYGVILFQEQMLAVAMVLAGFSGTEAEELRRAMGFQRHTERLERVLGKLRATMLAHGHTEALVAWVIDAAQSFALYGFPESHAISFALLAYASMWLKVHRPAEFTASLLNNQPMGFYVPATLVQDARRHGLKVRPVCVLASGARCTVEADDTIRIGLNYVAGLRAAAVDAMLAARAERPFASLDDWLRRTTFTAAERRALAGVGALNGLAAHRRAALWQVEAAWSADEDLLQRYAAEDRGPTAPLTPMTPAERYGADFATLGLTTGTHPMALVRDRLPDVWRAGDLPLGRDGQRVTIAGIVICRQRPGTGRGVVFVSVEDETGIANAIVRAELFERRRLVINQEPVLRIAGRLQNESGVIHVRAEEITALGIAGVPAVESHDFH